MSPSRTIPRDLETDGVCPVVAIAVFYSDPPGWVTEHRTAAAGSDEILEELLAVADILVMVPTHNFGIAPVLRVRIDHIVCIGKTFAFAFVVIFYEADCYAEGNSKPTDFVARYLKFILGFIGVTDVTIVPVEGMNVGKADLAESRARFAIDAIAG